MEFEQWRLLGEDEFTREYEAAFPTAAPSGVGANDTVRLRVVTPAGLSGPVPAVVILHYWGATDINLEIAMGRTLAKAGVAGVVMTLPYHLQRTPPGSRSGEMALQADPTKLRATMTQSVLDVRRTVDWIASRPEFDSSRLGLAGTSLGAIVAGLAFTLEPRFTCGAFVLGGADVAHILWNSSRVVEQRETLRRQGYTEDRLRQELKSIEPLTYAKNPEPRPTLVVGARADTVVPPRATQSLIDGFGTSQTVWLDSGHYGGALVRSRLIGLMSRFLEAKLGGGAFEAPRTLSVPTLRVGLAATPERGLQVAVGTDLWRLNARRDAFLSPLLTPQGFQAFAGVRVSNGLAVGAMVLPKKVTWGAFWSVVF